MKRHKKIVNKFYLQQKHYRNQNIIVIYFNNFFIYFIILAKTTIQLLPPILLNWQPTKIFDEIMVKWTDPNDDIEKKKNNQEKASNLLINKNDFGVTTLKKFYILQ